MGNSPTKYSKERPRKNVHWKSAEPPSPPGKPTLAPGSFNTKPDVVTIGWEKPLYDGGSPIIGYLVEHRRTGSPNWVRATPLLVPYPEISLSGLEPGWRYQFRIAAENAVGKSEPSELSDPLTVTLQRNAITAPHFTTELRDTTAIENEKVEFRVNIIGTPTPQINWFKDGFEMFSSRRAKISTENTISSLVIHQAALTDEGEIKCTATNRAGHMVTKAILKLEAPPKIRLPRQYEDGLIIEAEEVVRLKVGVAGRPFPDVIWNHNGEVINSGGRYEIVTTEKNSTLKITNTKRSDRGEYLLKAINSLGEDTAFFLVTVTARPQPPLNTSITMSLGKSVTLSWSVPDDDGGCKIGNYIVEYFRIGWNVWLKAATTRQLTTTLNDLIEGSEYKFRVKAENPYGLSEPSKESEILFVQDPKRGITKPGEKDNQFEKLKQNLTSRKKNPSSVSSSKSSLDDDKSTKSSKSRSSLNIKLIPQIYDTENLAREMAYGTSDAVYTSKSIEPQIISSSEEILITDEITNEKIEPYKNETELREPDINQEIHNSSEFVLVLYPDKESKTEQKRRSFELSLEEVITPPPLSLSAPELGSGSHIVTTLRRSVSSTELLYERAMARFYQAVAFEESEKARKRSNSVINSEIRPRSKFNSFGENNCKSPQFGGVPDGFQKNLPTKTIEQTIEYNEEDSTKIDEVLRVYKKEDNEINQDASDFDEDYTASTASSDDSETEKFKQAVMSASIKKKKIIQDNTDDQELETYHPGNMEHRVMSPYRQLDDNLSAEVLFKPLPLPSSDYIPKPILKRPTADTTKTKSKLTPKSERKNLKKLFVRNKTSPNGVLENNNKESPVAVEIKLVTANGGISSADVARQKKMEIRQNSIEEEQVMIDHYSDIVKHKGSGRTTIPIYLNPEKLEIDAEESDIRHYQEDEQYFEKQLNTKKVKEPTRSSKVINERSVRSPIPKIDNEQSTQNMYGKSLNLQKKNRLESKQRDLSLTRRQDVISPHNERMRKPRVTSNRSQNEHVNNIENKSRTTKNRSNQDIHQSGLNNVLENEQQILNMKKITQLSVSHEKLTPEQEQLEVKAELKVRSTMNYLTDLTMFLVACWLYIFKDARFAIPILLLMVYRQLGNAVKDKIPNWIKRRKS